MHDVLLGWWYISMDDCTSSRTLWETITVAHGEYTCEIIVEQISACVHRH